MNLHFFIKDVLNIIEIVITTSRVTGTEFIISIVDVVVDVEYCV